MTLSEIKLLVDQAIASAAQRHQNPDEITVYIRTIKTGTVGHVPVTGIESLNMGFDWEKNSCLITPAKDLREIELNEIKELQKKYTELGTVIYQNRKANVKEK